MKRALKYVAWLPLILWASLLVHAQVQRLSNSTRYLPLNTANTATDTTALTVGQVSQFLLTGTPTAAALYTTPTAAAWCAAFPFIASQRAKGYNYEFIVKNTAATDSNAITFAGGDGNVTFTTAPSISGGHMHVLRVIFKDCNTPVISIVPYGSNTF